MCTGKVLRGQQSYTFNQHNLPLRRLIAEMEFIVPNKLLAYGVVWVN